MSCSFDARKEKNQIINWIKEWFNQNAAESNAVIGISGGKDSTVVAAMCTEALGPDRVIGVMMPNGEQADIEDSEKVIEVLGINGMTVNVKEAYDALTLEINKALLGRGAEVFNYNLDSLSTATKTNIPPRLRMTTLYGIAQSRNGIVVNTCNLSEDYIGWSTKFGDCAGDIAPLANLTKTEVVAIGKELGLPDYLIEKAPADGLTGKADEDNFGFTYDVLDKYITEGRCYDIDIKSKIDDLHVRNLHKYEIARAIFHPTSLDAE